MISASCHCGAVEVAVASRPEAVTRCNCSVCRRLGAVWAFYAPGDVRITAAAAATAEYVWGRKTRRFVRCTTCGCTTHVLPIRPEPTGQVEVNVNLFDPAELGDPRVRTFDGAVTWKYVDDPVSAATPRPSPPATSLQAPTA